MSDEQQPGTSAADANVSRETPPTVASPSSPPPGAHEVFGAELDRASRYAELLAGPGVDRGLIGPREAPRLWDRHLINCALVAQVIPTGARVADLGSGAGLPGLVLALARPDLDVTLVEPLLRRSVFLQEAIEELDITTVRVLRSRAEELHPPKRARRRGAEAAEHHFDVVTARALAPMARLVAWAMPLVAGTGELVAMKGSSAAAEVTDAAQELSRHGCAPPRIETLRSADGSSTATVVRVAHRGGRRVP